MKVLHLISSSGLYGAEAVILSLLQSFPRGADRAALAVFANGPQDQPRLLAVARARGFEAHALVCKRQLDLSVPSALRSLVRETETTLVHAHGYKADCYAYAALRGARLPLVSTCHTWYDNDVAVRLYGALDRRLLRRFARVVAVSDEVRNRLRSAGVAEQRICLIRNGVDVASFNVPRQASATGALRFGLVGRLAPEKGVDLFLEAAAQVYRECPDARFAVAGDGPDLKQLEAKLLALGLTGVAALLGRQDDMRAFYASLDVLVSASRLEGLPVALLEGMASGLPVIGTAAGAVPLLIRPGETGLLAPVEDAGALAAAMLTLARQPALRSRLGEQARALVEQEFSIERMTEEYRCAYDEAANATSS